MKRSTWTAALLLCLAASAPPAAAQDRYNFTVGLLGGIGGTSESDDFSEFEGRSVQLNLGMVTNVRTHVVVRLGRIDLDTDGGFEGLDNAELEYGNVAGEYKFDQGYYDFGMYLGLGAYRLKGDPRPGGPETETALGGVIGIDGDFDVTRHLSVIAEGAAHYAFFDELPSLYFSAGAGLAFHF